MENDFLFQRLHTLKQFSTVEFYQKQFELLRSLVAVRYPALDEAYYVSCCINGLKDDIKNVVQFYQPLTVRYALCLTTFQESIFADEARVIVDKLIVEPTLSVEVSRRDIGEEEEISHRTSEVQSEDIVQISVSPSFISINSGDSTILENQNVNFRTNIEQFVPVGVEIPMEEVRSDEESKVINTQFFWVAYGVTLSTETSADYDNNAVTAVVFCALLDFKGGTYKWESVSTILKLESLMLAPKIVRGWPPWSDSLVKGRAQYNSLSRECEKWQPIELLHLVSVDAFIAFSDSFIVGGNTPSVVAITYGLSKQHWIIPRIFLMAIRNSQTVGNLMFRFIIIPGGIFSSIIHPRVTKAAYGNIPDKGTYKSQIPTAELKILSNGLLQGGNAKMFLHSYDVFDPEVFGPGILHCFAISATIKGGRTILKCIRTSVIISTDYTDTTILDCKDKSIWNSVVASYDKIGKIDLMELRSMHEWCPPTKYPVCVCTVLAWVLPCSTRVNQGNEVVGLSKKDLEDDDSEFSWELGPNRLFTAACVNTPICSFNNSSVNILSKNIIVNGSSLLLLRVDRENMKVAEAVYADTAGSIATQNSIQGN